MARPHDTARDQPSTLRRLLAPTAAELPPVRVWGSLQAGVAVAVAFVAIVFLYDQLLPHTPLASVLLEGGLLVLLVALVLWRRRSLPPVTAAIPARKRARWIVIGGVTVLCTATVVGLLLHVLLPDELHGIGHAVPSDTEGRILAGLAMVVLAPIVEETVFRGWLMRSLTTRVAPLGAVLISGTIFGGLHIWLARYSLEMGLELFFVGYALAYLCLHSGSMIPNIAGHMTLNFTAFFSVVAKPVDTVVIVLVAVALITFAVSALKRRRHARHAAGATAAATA